MKLTFSKIFYDFTSDAPLAIFKSETKKSFYFKISVHTAEDIINFNKNKNSTKSNIQNIFVDFFKKSNGNIEKLTIEKLEQDNHTGYLQILMNGKKFYYYLSADDIILLAVLFNKQIEAEPLVFYDFLEFQEEKFFSDKTLKNDSNMKY